MEEMSLMVLQQKKSEVCCGMYNNKTHNSGTVNGILELNKQKIWKCYVLTKNKLDGTGTQTETSATFLPVQCSM